MNFLLFSIPIFIVDAIDTEGLPLPDKKVMLRINNSQDIECYYPAYYEPGTMIVMRSGQKFITDISIEDIDRHIAGFYDQLAKIAARQNQGILIPTMGQA